jgi:hypothetical protein
MSMPSALAVVQVRAINEQSDALSTHDHVNVLFDLNQLARRHSLQCHTV